MTREGLIKHWDLVVAFKEGAAIEYRRNDGNWEGIKSIGWFDSVFYRIKPKEEFKAGDVVEVVSVEKAKCETENWMSEELIGIERGDRFVVEDASCEWIRLHGFKHKHPAEKFKKIGHV